jgi:hypothetical protein
MAVRLGKKTPKNAAIPDQCLQIHHATKTTKELKPLPGKLGTICRA